MPLLEVIQTRQTSRRGGGDGGGGRQEAGQDGDRRQRRHRLLHQPHPRPDDERGQLPAHRGRLGRGHRPGDDRVGLARAARSRCSTRWASTSPRHVGPIMLAAFGARMAPPPTIEPSSSPTVARAARTRRGFYLYGARREEGGSTSTRPSTTALGLPGTEAAEDRPSRSRRSRCGCSLQLVNEALHCLGEGILASAARRRHRRHLRPGLSPVPRRPLPLRRRASARARCCGGSRATSAASARAGRRRRCWWRWRARASASTPSRAAPRMRAGGGGEGGGL